MKVCIPSMEYSGLNNAVSQHFGRAPTYTVVDIETNGVESIPNTGEHMGGNRVPPDFLSEAGVNIMICAGLGPKAVQMFENYGIEVYIGAQGTVQQAIQAWESGKLEKANRDNACKDHHH